MKPEGDVRELKFQQKLARWRYYGKFGSLEFAQATLRNISEEFGSEDPALVLHCQDALKELENVKKALAGHKEDWRILK